MASSCLGFKNFPALQQANQFIINQGKTLGRLLGRHRVGLINGRILKALAQFKLFRLKRRHFAGQTFEFALLKKDMPLMINRFGGWLNYPEYFFFWCYHGQNAVFNTMSYQAAEMDKFITNARFAESKAIYEDQVRGMIRKAFADVPRVPLFQPTQDVAMQKNISGFTYWFHLQPDYRQIVKN